MARLSRTLPRVVVVLLTLSLCLTTASASSLLNTVAREDIVDILLLGIDVNEGPARSDAIIIMRVDSGTGQIKLVSIARDTYVKIYGRNIEDRINTAYFFGGAPTAVFTVNDHFGTNLELYMSITFEGVTELIDALGGVDVEVYAEELHALEQYDIPRLVVTNADGTYHLNGAQAVLLMRIRKIDSDHARTSRQRRVIQSLMGKMSQNIAMDTILDLASVVLSHVETNVSVTEVLPVLLPLVQDPGRIVFEELSLPEYGAFSYETIDEKSVITLTDEQWQRTLDTLWAFLAEKIERAPEYNPESILIIP